MPELRSISVISLFVGLLISAVSLDAKQAEEDVRKRIKIDDGQKVIVITSGKAAAYRYVELSREDKQAFDEAIVEVHRLIVSMIRMDPDGDLTSKPVQQALRCRFGKNENGYIASCSHGGYFCSVAVHPDHGIAGWCGGSDGIVIEGTFP